MRLVALTLLALVAARRRGDGCGASRPRLALDRGRAWRRPDHRARACLVGHIEKGSLEIVDLTPADQWSPRVNGIPRGRKVWLRGKKISFYVPSGQYRIVAHGTDISISARGTGTAVLDGDPDAVGDTGRYAIGDGMATRVPLPVEGTKVSFGGVETSTSSSQSVKIQP